MDPKHIGTYIITSRNLHILVNQVEVNNLETEWKAACRPRRLILSSSVRLSRRPLLVCGLRPRLAHGFGARRTESQDAELRVGATAHESVCAQECDAERLIFV